MSKKNYIKASNIKPLKDIILVTDLESGEKLTSSGLYIPSDDGKNRGIRARLCKVWAVGPEIDYVAPGAFLLVSHGRWTNGFDVELNGDLIRLWRVDNNEILLAFDEYPEKLTVLSKVDN